MHLSNMRGVRLLVTVLCLAILAGGMMVPVSAAATGSPTVAPESTVPDPLGTEASTAPTVATTKAPTSPSTTKATAAPTSKATTAPTTKKVTAPPTTAKTSAPVTTVPKATTLPKPATPRGGAALTTKATTAPTQFAALPAAVTVVSAPTIVAGTYTVPSGTGKFTVTSVGNVPVGGDGVVQLICDNGWQPLFGDTYIDVSWDPTMVTYKGAAIKVLNTTAAVSNDHTVRIMLGDFRRGYPQGKYPLAAITLRALREGTSPLTVSVDHVRYWNSDFTEFTDITATASGQAGLFSTGALPSETQPLVTFTQNTLAPSEYPTFDLDQASVGTVATYPAGTTPTPPPPDITVETVATPPPLFELVTDTPPATPAPGTTGTFAPSSTRVRTSGVPPAFTTATSLAVLGAVALLARRRG